MSLAPQDKLVQPLRPHRTNRYPWATQLSHAASLYGQALLVPVVLFAVWVLSTEQGWISPQVLPPPAYVWESLLDLIGSGELWLHVEASVRRVAVGYVAGSIIGLALGIVVGVSRHAERLLMPTLNALVQIPVLAWLPFVMLLVGIGEALKYILIAKAALVPTLMSTFQLLRQQPQRLLEVAHVYGYSPSQRFLHLSLPAGIPVLFTGLRLGFTKAWLSLVVVELVASSEGLGYLIVYGRQLFQLDLVMATVFIVGLIGLLIDRALDWLERRVLTSSTPRTRIV
ncbi:ABC transporter permease [Paenalcaligenes suwonensis]|uniref:ABC transporter permease n=1 Tax=Paenalcaligenes suwonensis TaxID=1202713 RepID=UPI001408DF67|nr:ABC transporter permease [Paenalcaligenes suwonensis]NHC61538.1 ABC transporter permease [Paenalcaligenes suwonensis]